jgi:ParB family transcriptional regulator, chromosome partitioning protein
MSEDGRKRSLGRGLSALLGAGSDDYADEHGKHIKMVPTEHLQRGRYQPRRRFDEAEMKALAESIRENGILQPILVRRLPPDTDGAPSGTVAITSLGAGAGASGSRYEIIAGERRWRAAQLARLHEVPVIAREMDDRQALEIALVENVQRQDLNPLEEAEGYRRLIEEFNHTQENLARAIGKSRSHIANMLRLLSLPPVVRELVDSGALTAGHARALITAGDPAALARLVVARGLNVRQTERLVKGHPPGRTHGPAGPKDADTVALERELTNLLGLKVSIAAHGEAGTLMIHYSKLEQLDDLLGRLTQGAPH